MESQRIECFKGLEKTIGPYAAVYLEAYAFTRACSTGTLCGIPVWQYSSGVSLFETDKPDVHLKELLGSYLDQIAALECILEETNLRPILAADPSKIGDYQDHDIKRLTDYGTWHDKYLEDIAESKRVLEERHEDTSAFIKCSKCHSNRVDTEQKQTRSADEPMTVFCLCRNCGKRFTMN
jgi:DNA-directed RNA polymerase subunit M/transcription elongation factor TFIIS